MSAFHHSNITFHLTDGCRENFSIELESINHLAKNYNLMTIFGNLEVCINIIVFYILNLFLKLKYSF